MTTEEKAHDTMSVGVCLSLTGGFLDAYSYLLKGKVFANAQTGNLVLLFVSAAGGEWGRASKYLVPVATFAFGIFLSALVSNKSALPARRRLFAVLSFEAAAIAAIGFWGIHFQYDIVNSVISFIAVTPDLCARSTLSPNGKNASEPSAAPVHAESQSSFSCCVKGSGLRWKVNLPIPFKKS